VPVARDRVLNEGEFGAQVGSIGIGGMGRAGAVGVRRRGRGGVESRPPARQHRFNAEGLALHGVPLFPNAITFSAC